MGLYAFFINYMCFGSCVAFLTGVPRQSSVCVCVWVYVESMWVLCCHPVASDLNILSALVNYHLNPTGSLFATR